jgi:hypothetical protein
MLTDYAAHCPYNECGWRGYLFPQGSQEAWRPAAPTQREITFLCPRCHREWQARIVGDDAVNLPLPAAAGQGA